MKIKKYSKSVLMLLMMFVLSNIVSAQENKSVIDIDYYSPKEYEVGEIKITGAENLDENSVILLSEYLLDKR